jgi:hypothetical protein
MIDKFMNSKLSKDEVLNNLRIWETWINGPDPANNEPDEFISWENTGPNGMKSIFGMLLHLFLWSVTTFGLIFRVSPIAIWAAKNSVKYDYLRWEPLSCGLNNAYTLLGTGYYKAGSIEAAIKCLKKSWRVYPCPHNTSFGLRLNLYKKLRDCPDAKEATAEYLDMWKRLKRV